MPDRALRVAELDRMVIPRTEPILQDERAHAHRVEPRRDLAPFVIHRQRAVAAAGRHDDARTRGRRAAL